MEEAGRHDCVLECRNAGFQDPDGREGRRASRSVFHQEGVLLPVECMSGQPDLKQQGRKQREDNVVEIEKSETSVVQEDEASNLRVIVFENKAHSIWRLLVRRKMQRPTQTAGWICRRVLAPKSGWSIGCWVNTPLR